MKHIESGILLLEKDRGYVVSFGGKIRCGAGKNKGYKGFDLTLQEAEEKNQIGKDLPKEIHDGILFLLHFEDIESVEVVEKNLKWIKEQIKKEKK